MEEEGEKKRQGKKDGWGINVEYTYAIKGRGCRSSSKGQKAAGLEEKAGSAGG